MINPRQTFPFHEKTLSQIPALQLLINLGYTYLNPEQAFGERGRKYGSLLLENILREQLKKINRIRFKGGEHLFSEENIQSGIEKIKNVPYQGLQKTNEEIYDLLTLGTSLQQTVEGDTRGRTLKYIDWENPAANAFHVTAEFPVERSRSGGKAIPDIVLFVNGIPFVVIECKGCDVDVEEGVSQNIRNQGDEYIPRLFAYAQVVMAMNKNEAKYATAGTGKKFWSVWKELEDSEKEVKSRVNKTLSDEEKNRLFSGEFASARRYFEDIEEQGGRLVTAQDKSVYSLCRPERLLEIVYGFTIFDAGSKKIARYQQFFLTRSAIGNVKTKDDSGRRQGGIVWHTQGSGKSITMVMLTRALALDPELRKMRLILVTDRKDLDKQLGNTFAACGLVKHRAKTGRDLAGHIRNRTDIITTLINKFESASSAGKYIDDSPDIVVLVDESHRTNYGELAAKMRKMLPNACYIGFTGTPLLRREKNTFARFGKLIDPPYPVRTAMEDKQVVPLIYEGRHVEIKPDKEAIDKWFGRHTEGLSGKQKADLKSKYSKAKMLNKADRVVYMRAFDISCHFRENWQGTGFKAQLVAPDKSTALKYHKYLREVGTVSSEVIISAPDTRKGHEEAGAESAEEVARFWKRMMEEYGGEENYNKSITDRFKESDHPEILIVVDKLLTGFDAPRNTVLYLCRSLKDHTLLQAIARVNRLHEGKEYGCIIDYASVLGELDKALTEYEALAGFEEKDIADLLFSIRKETEKLPRLHSELWDIFNKVGNSADEEEYERHLADDKLRDDFYERLTAYGKTLAVALSSEKFITETDGEELKRYKEDLKRFYRLRKAVRMRYAEEIDYKEYEPKIKKLLDTHIKADDVTQLVYPADIFDDKEFARLTEQAEDYEAKTAATADIIAHATKRRITESMDKDPAFYEKFSKLIQDAIDDFRQRRISDIEYLQRAKDIRDKAVGKRDDVPESISGNGEASAYFGKIKPCLEGVEADGALIERIAADTAVAIQEILKRNWKVDFWNDSDAQKKTKNDIDNFLYDEIEDVRGIDLTERQMDDIINETLRVAKFWKPC